MMHPPTPGGSFGAVTTRAPPYVPPPPATTPDFFWPGAGSGSHLTRSESSQTLPTNSGVEQYRKPGKQTPPSYYDAIRTRHSLSQPVFHQGDPPPPDSRYYQALQQKKYNSLPRPLPQRYPQFHPPQSEPTLINGHGFSQEGNVKGWGPQNPPSTVQNPIEDHRMSNHVRRGPPLANGVSPVPNQPLSGGHMNGFGDQGSIADRDHYRRQYHHYQWTKTGVPPPDGLHGYRIQHIRGNSEPQLIQRSAPPFGAQQYPTVGPPREGPKGDLPPRHAQDVPECPVPSVMHPELSSRKSDPVVKPSMRDAWKNASDYHDGRRLPLHVPPRQTAPYPQTPPHPLTSSSDSLPNLEWSLGPSTPSQPLNNSRHHHQTTPPMKNISGNGFPSGTVRPNLIHPPESNQTPPRRGSALSPTGGNCTNGVNPPDVSQRSHVNQEQSRQASVQHNNAENRQHTQTDGSPLKGKPPSLASPSPWEREEKEKMRTKQLEKARRTRDNEIKKLENLACRTARQEELLRTLQLEQEFQRRAEEAPDEEEDDDEDNLLERAETRERMLMMQNEMEKSRVERLEKKMEELVRTKNQPLSPQEEWARRRMRLQLSQIAEESGPQKNNNQHHCNRHHKTHSRQQSRTVQENSVPEWQANNQERSCVQNGDVSTSHQVALESPHASLSPIPSPSGINTGGSDQHSGSRSGQQVNNCESKKSPSRSVRPNDSKGRSPPVPPRARSSSDQKDQQVEGNDFRCHKREKSIAYSSPPLRPELQQSHPHHHHHHHHQQEVRPLRGETTIQTLSVPDSSRSENDARGENQRNSQMLFLTGQTAQMSINGHHHLVESPTRGDSVHSPRTRQQQQQQTSLELSPRVESNSSSDRHYLQSLETFVQTEEKTHSPCNELPSSEKENIHHNWNIQYNQNSMEVLPAKRTVIESISQLDSNKQQVSPPMRREIVPPIPSMSHLDSNKQQVSPTRREIVPSIPPISHLDSNKQQVSPPIRREIVPPIPSMSHLDSNKQQVSPTRREIVPPIPHLDSNKQQVSPTRRELAPPIPSISHLDSNKQQVSPPTRREMVPPIPSKRHFYHSLETAGLEENQPSSLNEYKRPEPLSLKRGNDTHGSPTHNLSEMHQPRRHDNSHSESLTTRDVENLSPERPKQQENLEHSSKGNSEHNHRYAETMPDNKISDKDPISTDPNSENMEQNKRPLSGHTWTAKPVYLQPGVSVQENTTTSKPTMEQKSSPPRVGSGTDKGKEWKGLSSGVVTLHRIEQGRRDKQKLWDSRPEKLSFHEKVRKFAMQSGEADLPKDKVKHSRAQREIENRLNGVLNPEDSTKKS